MGRQAFPTAGVCVTVADRRRSEQTVKVNEEYCQRLQEGRIQGYSWGMIVLDSDAAIWAMSARMEARKIVGRGRIASRRS